MRSITYQLFSLHEGRVEIRLSFLIRKYLEFCLRSVHSPRVIVK